MKVALEQAINYYAAMIRIIDSLIENKQNGDGYDYGVYNETIIGRLLKQIHIEYGGIISDMKQTALYAENCNYIDIMPLTLSMYMKWYAQTYRAKEDNERQIAQHHFALMDRFGHNAYTIELLEYTGLTEAEYILELRRIGINNESEMDQNQIDFVINYCTEIMQNIHETIKDSLNQ